MKRSSGVSTSSDLPKVRPQVIIGNMRTTITMQRASLALLALLLIACAGTRAREHALWPLVSSTWPVVLEDINLATEVVAESSAVTSAIGQINNAIGSDDYTLLLGLNWAVLEPLVFEGVQIRIRGGLNPGIAVSLDERNKKFSSAMQELIKR